MVSSDVQSGVVCCTFPSALPWQGTVPAVDLSTQLQRSHVTLFFDIQVAYYEASRQLMFEDAALDLDDSQLHLCHPAFNGRVRLGVPVTGAITVLGFRVQHRGLKNSQCSVFV